MDDNCIEYIIASGNLKLNKTCTGELVYPYVVQVKAGAGVTYTTATIENMEWSTFWGGEGDDGCYDLDIDANGNMLIAGFADQSTLKKEPGNAFSPSVKRVGTGLITFFNQRGENRWNTFVSSSKGTLMTTPNVSIKTVDTYNSLAGFAGDEIHVLGEYIGLLSPEIKISQINAATTYQQTNSTIASTSRELWFGIFRSDGVLVMKTPFGGDDFDEVFCADISDDGLLYFAGSTKSDGNQTNGSRLAQTGHKFPLYNPADNSFFTNTNPTAGTSNSAFVSVIDLNPISSFQFQLAYSSFITGGGANPYVAIYDIIAQDNHLSWCGKGLTGARIGYDIDRPASTAVFASNLNHANSSWTNKEYFCKVVRIPSYGPGMGYGGFFLGLDSDGNDALLTGPTIAPQFLVRNQYQSTTGDAFLVEIEDDQILWDTYFGLSGNQKNAWSGPVARPGPSLNSFYGNSILGKGSLSYFEPRAQLHPTNATLFMGGTIRDSPVETKTKTGFFTENTIDGNSMVEDLYVAAFGNDVFNTTAFSWGTIWGDEGDDDDGNNLGRDYLAGIQSYELNGETYLSVIGTGYSLTGTFSSNPEFFPVVRHKSSYFEPVNHDKINQSTTDVLITRYRVTEVTNPVSIEEFKDNKSFNIFPNPTTSEITIQLADGKKIRDVSLIDLSGRVLLSKSYANNSKARVTLSVGQLASGIYLIEINGEFSQQLVKL